MGPGEMGPGGRMSGFYFTMDRRRLILGLIWLPIYIFILPILLTVLQEAYPAFSDSYAEFLRQALSAVVLFAALFPFLRAEFDGLMNRKGRAVFAILGGLVLYFTLSYICTILGFMLIPNAESVFNTWSAEANTWDRGPVFAALVILAPLTEGLLFRGCVFGPLREKRKGLAYLFAVVVCVAAQTWPYALGGLSAELPLAILQAIPAAIVLCWSYETSQSLWASIFLQMLIGALNI